MKILPVGAEFPRDHVRTASYDEVKKSHFENFCEST